MKCNVGKIDRIIRIVAGAAILGAGVYLQSWWGAVGLVLLGTAFVKLCPIYMLLRLNTCEVEQG